MTDGIEKSFISVNLFPIHYSPKPITQQQQNYRKIQFKKKVNNVSIRALDTPNKFHDGWKQIGKTFGSYKLIEREKQRAWEGVPQLDEDSSRFPVLYPKIRAGRKMSGLIESF